MFERARRSRAPPPPHRSNTGALATVDIGTALGVIYGARVARLPSLQPSFYL